MDTGGKSSWEKVGEFLRMDDPEMDNIPSRIVNLERLKTSPEYLCYEHKLEENVDKDDLKSTHQKHAQFEISHLVHDAKLDNFFSILSDQTIKPGREKEIKGIGSFSFSWWGLSVAKQEKDNYLSEMKRLIKGPKGCNAMLKTGPFNNTSRYGHFRITQTMSELLEHYKKSTGKEYEKRILWTVVYRYEIMHTILVHPKDEKFEEEFGHLQTMEDYMADNEHDEGSYPVVKDVGGKWKWCPQTTSMGHPDTTKENETLKSWEHLTFAFLIPDGCEGISIPNENLLHNLSFQRIGKTNLSRGEDYKTVNGAITALLEKAPLKLDKKNLQLLFKQIPESISLLEKKIRKKDIKQIKMKFDEIILEIFEGEGGDFNEVLMNQLAERKKRAPKARDVKQSSKSRKGSSEKNEPKKDGEKSGKRKKSNTEGTAVEEPKEGCKKSIKRKKSSTKGAGEKPKKDGKKSRKRKKSSAEGTVVEPKEDGKKSRKRKRSAEGTAVKEPKEDGKKGQKNKEKNRDELAAEKLNPDESDEAVCFPPDAPKNEDEECCSQNLSNELNRSADTLKRYLQDPN